MSRNIVLTSLGGLYSNDDWISCFMERSWDIQESAGVKPDWDLLNRLLLPKWEKRKLNKSFSKTLPNIGERLIGL